MPWFRASSVIFAVWAVVFIFFPRFSNEFGGVGYVTSKHAEDWTQIVVPAGRLRAALPERTSSGRASRPTGR